MKSFQERARHLRYVTGSTELEKTLRKAVKALAFYNIPHWVAGGFAVQERGYSHFTEDVDIIVPDVAEARDKLCISGFRENPGSSMTITDRRSTVEIDLLPGGRKLSPTALLPLPIPSQVSDEPQILPLRELIEAKLSAGRLKDSAAVAELIKRNSLTRTFALDPAVRDRYSEIWDKAAAESAVEGLLPPED